MSPRVYGPVPSRRFGLSLGVDVVPFKVCTYDCIYCQLGATTHKTVQREAFYTVEEILADIRDALEQGPKPDVITFAGSGEPTLYRELGALVDGIRAVTDTTLLLITNGSLLWRDDVARDAQRFDIVAPSLDAPDAETLEVINQSGDKISFRDVAEGLVQFRSRFEGKLYLEVFLLEGVNDSTQHIDAFRRWVQRIQPDRVDVNTVARPVPGRNVKGVSHNRLKAIAQALDPKARSVEDYDYSQAKAQARAGQSVVAEAILNTVGRRPCTIDDLAASLGYPHQEIVKAVELLQSEEKVTGERRNEHIYYRPLD